jgi:hypothetical protein
MALRTPGGFAVATIDGTVPFAVLCENETCEHFGEAVNEFAVPGIDVDMFCEVFGRGAEDPEDYCPSRGVLGGLSELDVPACACRYCTDEAERVSYLPLRPSTLS